MNFTIKVWRQKSPEQPGKLETYQAKNISSHMSFLEMLNSLNRDLILQGIEPIEFEYDCMEGICGTCSLMIDGVAHGPERGTTCQLHMRSFKDGDTITIEPWRAKSFPVIKDLVVDRTSFERVIQAGGYISVNTGSAPEANAIPIGKNEAEQAMDAAQCIGCGACVASCKNSSAMLFVSAKVAHLSLLPQGQVEKNRRVKDMIEQMDKEGFGACTNQYECEAVCPKEISAKFIAKMNRDYLKASFLGDSE